jgi:hypothetical protein
MPGYSKGTAFTQFTNPPLPTPDTRELRRSLCRPDGPNAPFTSAPTLIVTFVPEPGDETLLLSEPWEDIP